ncbi:MAG TPA: Uma2 family endonuclease [Blastocatellia bacterium]|nr:Uma2 family endonuclease [Blastocatellia bacterium]
MNTTTRHVSADELLRMPDDGFRYELVKGELRRMSPAGHKHGRIAATFTWRLGPHVKTNNLGVVYAAETGFLLSTDPDTVRAPDVAFVSRARLEEVGEVEGFWPGAPDLAVEVISPGDTYTEVEEKVIEWLEAGAKMFLVLNPRKRTVAVNRPSGQVTVLNEEATLDIDDVVPGFTAAVRDLFD